MQDFAKKAHSVHHLSEKSKDFFGDSEAQEAFEVLKARLTSASILALPSMREAFILYTDASQHAWVPFSLKFKKVPNVSFVTHPYPSAKLRADITPRNVNFWPL